jgi:hypothetical protein
MVKSGLVAVVIEWAGHGGGEVGVNGGEEISPVVRRDERLDVAGTCARGSDCVRTKRTWFPRSKFDRVGEQCEQDRFEHPSCDNLGPGASSDVPFPSS